MSQHSEAKREGERRTLPASSCRVCGNPVADGFTCCGSTCLKQERTTPANVPVCQCGHSWESHKTTSNVNQHNDRCLACESGKTCLQYNALILPKTTYRVVTYIITGTGAQESAELIDIIEAESTLYLKNSGKNVFHLIEDLREDALQRPEDTAPQPEALTFTRQALDTHTGHKLTVVCYPAQNPNRHELYCVTCTTALPATN